ncbi:MAG TPA: glycine betaine ABC transporter substrate-binding protein [Candidatus Acidoferrum sp.]|nr:glycine betaine ABC transporter substrate-binding protein [Candidatus Acidoferrum sp.]
MRRRLAILAALLFGVSFFVACKNPTKKKVVIGSKFFTEQVVLAELLAQHIESRTGIPVERKTNLGGTLLIHKAMLAGDLDMYVEYTGTALTAVLGEAPKGDSKAVYERVKEQYAKRFGLEVTDPLGFENTFAMVVRGEDAERLHLKNMSDLAPIAPKWHAAVGYEFLERPDGFQGWSQTYGLRFAETPRVMDLGLLYRALTQHQADIVAGNSTDGLIETLHLIPLKDDRHYFPPYDAVPVVRRSALQQFPQLRTALADLAGKISAEDMRRMNAEVDAGQRDVKAVVHEFREAHGL